MASQSSQFGRLIFRIPRLGSERRISHPRSKMRLIGIFREFWLLEKNYVFNIIRDAGLIDRSVARPDIYLIILFPILHFQFLFLYDLDCLYLMLMILNYDILKFRINMVIIA